MKSFIERIFKSKKLKKEKEVKVVEQATEAMVKSIVEEAPKVEVPKLEIPKVQTPKQVFKKPGHYFPDCNCPKCVTWRNQNAK